MTTVSKESGLRPHMHALGPEGRLRFPGITEGPLAVRRLNGTDWLVVVGTPTDPLTDLALPRYANLVGEWVAGYSTQQTGNPETRAKASARLLKPNRRLGFQTPDTAARAATHVMTSLGEDRQLLAGELEALQAFLSTTPAAITNDKSTLLALRLAHANRAQAVAWMRQLMARHYAALASGTEHDGRGGRRPNPPAAHWRAQGAVRLVGDQQQIVVLGTHRNTARLAAVAQIRSDMSRDLQQFLNMTLHPTTPLRATRMTAIRRRNPSKPLCFIWWHAEWLKELRATGRPLSSDRYPRERHEELHIAALLEQQLQTLDAWLSLMRDNNQIYAETTYSHLRMFLASDLDLYNPLQQQLIEAILAQCRRACDLPNSREHAIREAKHLIRHRVWPRLGGASKRPHRWAEAYCSPSMRLALQAAIGP